MVNALGFLPQSDPVLGTANTPQGKRQFPSHETLRLPFLTKYAIFLMACLVGKHVMLG
jgi:hypothetical protein